MIHRRRGVDLLPRRLDLRPDPAAYLRDGHDDADREHDDRDDREDRAVGRETDREEPALTMTSSSRMIVMSACEICMSVTVVTAAAVGTRRLRR